MKAQQFFRILAPVMDQMNGGITIADVQKPGSPLVYATRAFIELTGFPLEEVLGRNCRFLQGPETRPESVAAIREAVAKGRQHRVTLLNYRRDGRTFWNDLRLSPVHNSLGQLTHYVGLQSDVSSERRSAALERRTDALERSMETGGARLLAMEQILAHVPFGVLSLDAELRVSFLNRKAEQLLGVDAAASAGLPIREVWPDPALLDMLPLPSSVEERKSDLNVGSPPVKVGVTALRAVVDGAREPHHILMMRPLDEIHPGLQDLEQLRRLSALGSMAAGFAHQVRNPLAAVRSLAEAMREELDAADDRREYTRRILALVERIEALVRRSLRFTHSGAPRRDEVDPVELVHQAIEMLDFRWRTAGETATVDLPDCLPRVYVDRDHGIEILMILLENALDATSCPTEVRVTGRGPLPALGSTSGTFVALEVEDRGHGIPADVLGEIFDPFFTTKPRGTGLGLPIAMRLANEGAARLEVAASQEGVGTTFRLLLPVMHDPGGEPCA
ncbi:MAG: PAS domain-containing protein [Acidobacteriota bacterium]